jgi:hypothetical protein
MQVSRLLQKLYEGIDLDQEDWMFIAGIGMTTLYFLCERSSNINFTIGPAPTKTSRASKKIKKLKN